MVYFFCLLFFVAGAGGAIIFYRSRTHKLQKQLEELAVLRETESPPPPQQKAETSSAEEDLKRTIDNLYIVNDLGQNVTSSLNLRETFQHLYNTINSMMDTSVLELRVYREETEEWKVLSNIQYHNDPRGLSYTNHISDWCFQNKREVFLSDAERDYARYVFEPLVLPDGRMAKSLLAFPVISHGNISGTLCVISFRNNTFTEYHRDIIRLLLGYISVAMQNALTHEELNLTKIRAERSEKFMQQFLANMSHEIRTPINAVTGMTRLLLEKEPREEQMMYLESIRDASDSLLVIINDILDLSKIEAGRIELEHIDFSLLDVISNVKGIMQFKAEEKGLSLITEVDKRIPSVFIGDPTRLTQVLINLISNAVKFTEKGSVSLNVTGIDGYIPPNAKNKTPGSILNYPITFEIADTGIGMTEEQQSKLFQNYTQASTDISRKFGGTGLGLSISKQLVEIQGGTIILKSKPGEGSKFSFTLSYPVSKCKAVAFKEKVVSATMLNQLRGIRVLLADDNEYNRIVVKETLQLKIEDVVVSEALDGAMAVEMLKRNDYDIVLMDLVMPRMDGFEATYEIRHKLPDPKNAIRIIALTASVVKREIDKAYLAGMNGFIPKPFKPHELFRAIYDALHARNEPPTASYEALPATRDMSGNTINLVYLQEFTEGDQVRMQRHIDLFIEKIPAIVLELKAAMQAADYEKLRILAHSMKPQLKMLGVIRGLELAENIEMNCQEAVSSEQLNESLENLTGICKQAIEEILHLEAAGS